MGTASMINVLA